jgi:hypothetical protein
MSPKTHAFLDDILSLVHKHNDLPPDTRIVLLSAAIKYCNAEKKREREIKKATGKSVPVIYHNSLN